MKLTFLGGTKSVTGAMYLIETKDTKLIVDCGLYQGKRELRKLNFQDFGFDSKDLDYVLITHSHMDHVGRLPKLFKSGFRGKIYATKPAVELSHIFLQDSAHLQKEEAKEIGVEPLYDIEDVNKCMNFCKGIEYHQEIKLSNTVKFIYRKAGHILGSAIIEIWADDTKLVFTGDLGNPPVPILNPYDYIKDADYVIIESAYGNRNHEPTQNRKEIIEDAIEDTIKSGGTLMIPAFAMERTQEVLYEINDLIENHRVPRIPIFMDSPLAIKATEIFKRYEHYFNKETRGIINSGDDIFNFPGLKITRTSQESKKINDTPAPKIIIAGSGMSTGGRILFHEKLYLSDPKSMLFIVGYQVKGTLGRRLLDGENFVNILGKRVEVKAKIKACGAFSAHADQRKLLDWVKHIESPVKKVFVVQGEEDAAEALVSKIKNDLRLDAMAPELGYSIEL